MEKGNGVIRGHKEDRQPNGKKRMGSSEAIKRRRTDNPLDKKRKGSSEAINRRTDNPMDKRDRGHQRP